MDDARSPRHRLGPLWAPDATAVTDALATEAVDGILSALPVVLAQPAALPARSRLQAAAWLAGICLAQIRMGLHHQLAHVMAFDLPAAPAAAARLERVAGPDPWRWSRRWPARTAGRRPSASSRSRVTGCARSPSGSSPRRTQPAPARRRRGRGSAGEGVVSGPVCIS